MELQGAEKLVLELCDSPPSRPCPRWAVLGPRYSGKTQFLNEFIALCARSDHIRAPIPLYLDLKRIPIGPEERMYRAIYQQLDLNSHQVHIQVSSEGPLDGTGRFDHFVRDVLSQSNRRVALVIDHIDWVPHFFGRSLLRRLRLMIDQQDICQEFKRLCVLISGSTSLFDLRRSGDSEFIVSTLFFPYSGATPPVTSGRNGRTPKAVREKLEQLTGGEPTFWNLLCTEIDSERPPTIDLLEHGVEQLVKNADRHELFRHMILSLGSDRELRQLVQELLNSKSSRVVRRDTSPDIDHFCLSGIVVLKKEQNIAFYRFRNGIVERLMRKLVDNRGSEWSAQVRQECYEARDIFSALKNLLSLWKLCVPNLRAPQCFIHVCFNHSTLDLWIDFERQHVGNLSDMDSIPNSALQAIRAANETSIPHSTFGFDGKTISFVIPFARPGTSTSLILTFPDQSTSELNEASLGHWLRVLDECGPAIISSALAELSLYFSRQLERCHRETSIAAEPAPHTRIYWEPPDHVIVDAPGECTHHPIDLAAEKLRRTLEDLNQRCLRLVSHTQTTGAYMAELRGVAGETETLLLSCPALLHALRDRRDGDFLIVSDEEGLKLPFEILPLHTSHLALESRIARRIRNVPAPKTKAPLPTCLKQLLERGQPLRLLLAGADPRNNLQKLEQELDDLESRIRTACDVVGLQTEIRVIRPINCTFSALESELHNDASPYHFFHFCGHGEPGRSPDESSVILQGKRGDEDALTCERLRLLLQDRVLWLMYLSCCHAGGARGTPGLYQQYTGTIHAVLSAGIPNAIAFRCAVTDIGAAALAAEFYDTLLARDRFGDPSYALWQARRSVAADADKYDTWASSLLVTQCF